MLGDASIYEHHLRFMAEERARTPTQREKMLKELDAEIKRMQGEYTFGALLKEAAIFVVGGSILMYTVLTLAFKWMLANPHTIDQIGRWVNAL